VVTDTEPDDDGLEGADLPELAAVANQYHGLASVAKRNQVDAAWHSGRALNAAKELCKHGEWLPWLAENFNGSERTARVYMQIFMSYRQRAADMTSESVREALKAIQEADQPDVADVIKAWEQGHWRTSAPSNFNAFCTATYGRKAAAARRVVVAKLLDQGRTIGQIAEQTGARYGTARQDVEIIRGPGKKTKKKAPADPATAEKRKRREQLGEIRDRHARRLYEAMCNAPRNAVNTPMLNRATKAVQALAELAALDPEVAASQVPAVRCREYSGCAGLAEWLMKFIEFCDDRRRLETPALDHLRWTPEASLGSDTPRAEQGAVLARAVVDLLASHGPATEAELGVGIATGDIGRVLRSLVTAKRINVDQTGGTRVYRLCPINETERSHVPERRRTEP